jgi:hypothetical protein
MPWGSRRVAIDVHGGVAWAVGGAPERGVMRLSHPLATLRGRHAHAVPTVNASRSQP